MNEDPGWCWGEVMNYLSVGTALLLIASGFQLLIASLTPFLGFPVNIVGLSRRTDQKMWNDSTEQLLRDRVVRELRTHHTIVIGGLLSGVAILQVFLVGYGVRTGQVWALSAMTLMGVAMLAWWIAMVLQFTRAGVPVGLGDVQPFVWVHIAFWTPGIVLAWVGWKMATFTPPP